MPPKSISLLQINSAVLLWAGTAMFAKGIPLSVFHITGMRYLIASAALLLFMRVFKRPVLLKNRGECIAMVVLGLLLCGNGLTLFQSLKVSSAAVALLALYTYPTFTALLEPLVFKEKFKLVNLASAAIAFVGLLVMMPKFDLTHDTTKGVLLGVLAGIFQMLRSLMIRKHVRTLSSSTVIFWQMLVTGLIMTPWLLLQPATYNPSAWGLLILLGIVFTAAPQTLYAASLKGLSVRTVGIIATMQPLLAAGLGYLIYQEKIDGRTLIGGALILSCFAFEVLKKDA